VQRREVIDALAHHHELIARQPGRGVAGADSGAEPGRDGREDLVADAVAVPVVHRLEAVEVQEQHADVAAAPAAGEQRMPQPVLQEDAVGQTGEGVVQRERRQLLELPGVAALARGDSAGVLPALTGDDRNKGCAQHSQQNIHVRLLRRSVLGPPLPIGARRRCGSPARGILAAWTRSSS
jgi:hypothetical protein